MTATTSAATIRATGPRTMVKLRPLRAWAFRSQKVSQIHTAGRISISVSRQFRKISLTPSTSRPKPPAM